ncbi:SRPBCC family protein [Subtercola boreus]|nr:SRPBCC family protein [Subtercola boreus]TQL54535.1 polyketide cyclase/dehydrase/lipid transport protein [Subtercola boreus]
MVSIREHGWLASAAATVWEVVGSPSAITEWAPSIASAVMDGSLRTLTLKRGGEIVEEIVTLDDELRRIQYAVRSGLPVTAHLATVDVIPTGESSCLVLYSTDLSPDGLAAPIARSMQNSISALVERFGAYDDSSNRESEK